MMTKALDREVTNVLASVAEFNQLFAAGKICGFEAVCGGWTINVYVGTYELGEFVEGCMRRDDIAVRLNAEQAQRLRSKLPEHMPLPETTP